MKTLILVASLIFTGSAFAQETTTKVGDWRYGNGPSMKFSVVKTENRVRADIFVSDSHVIRTVLFYRMNKQDLESIKRLLDETIKEMDRQN